MATSRHGIELASPTAMVLVYGTCAALSASIYGGAAYLVAVVLS